MEHPRSFVAVATLSKSGDFDCKITFSSFWRGLNLSPSLPPPLLKKKKKTFNFCAEMLKPSSHEFIKK